MHSDDVDAGEKPDLAMFREPVERAGAGPGARSGETEPSDDADVPTVPPPRPLRIIAVGGAKGGVGKTILATNLALYLATIGRRVVIVDADAGGANVHTSLGLERPARTPRGRRGDSQAPASAGIPWATMVETTVPGLRLLDAALDDPTGDAVRTRRRSLMLARLRALDADYVVVDLGASTGHTLVDFFLAADLGAFVMLPEPTAIESTYRFLRAAFARRVRAELQSREERRALATVLAEMGGAPAPSDLVQRLERTRDPLATIVRREMEAFHPRVILNQTRVRSDLELGDAVRTAVRRRFGITIDYLGHVDFDDTVWSCVRARRPLLVESPGTKASKSIEKIARRLLAADGGKGRLVPRANVPVGSHHDLLEVDRGATDEEVRRAFKRAKEIYAREALACYGLFTAGEVQALGVKLEEAYDVLLDPVRRRPYEISVFPPEPDPSVAVPQPAEAGDPRPPAPEITPETEFIGSLLRQVRESQGIELSDIVKRTKISVSYLRAIEEEDYAALPPVVYARGFVNELAKCLRLDAPQVSRSYIRRYRRYLEERPKP